MEKVNDNAEFLPINDPLLKEAILNLKKKFDCHTIILYGSRAFGEGVSSSSDYDLAAFTKSGQPVRDAYILNDHFIDAWIYPESIIDNVDESFLRMKDGIIIEEESQFGQTLLKNIDELFKKGPSKIPDWEKSLINTWLIKMLERSKSDDIEGNYRRHWLLFDCLESYFKLSNQWYLGPKQSFKWLKTNDPKAYEAFNSALNPKASNSDIASLIKIVSQCIV